MCRLSIWDQGAYGIVAPVWLGMDSCEENCAVQETAGYGDQGRWLTCAVYAVCGVLRQMVCTRYGIELEDTSDMAKRIVGMNLKNTDGKDILQHGIGISELIKQLNDKMMKQDLLFFEKTDSGAPGAAIRFELQHKLLDWQRPWESVFQIPSRTPSRLRAFYDCPNWVVHASGPGGTHRHHAMQCQQLLIDCSPGACLLCSNSWGEAEKNMIVPNHSIYPTIEAIWVLSVDSVQKLSDPDSLWVDVNLSRGSYVQYVQSSFGNLEELSCRRCGMHFMREHQRPRPSASIYSLFDTFTILFLPLKFIMPFIMPFIDSDDSDDSEIHRPCCPKCSCKLNWPRVVAATCQQYG